MDFSERRRQSKSNDMSLQVTKKYFISTIIFMVSFSFLDKSFNKIQVFCPENKFS